MQLGSSKEARPALSTNTTVWVSNDECVFQHFRCKIVELASCPQLRAHFVLYHAGKLPVPNRRISLI